MTLARPPSSAHQSPRNRSRGDPSGPTGAPDPPEYLERHLSELRGDQSWSSTKRPRHRKKKISVRKISDCPRLMQQNENFAFLTAFPSRRVPPRHHPPGKNPAAAAAHAAQSHQPREIWKFAAASTTTWRENTTAWDNNKLKIFSHFSRFSAPVKRHPLTSPLNGPNGGEDHLFLVLASHGGPRRSLVLCQLLSTGPGLGGRSSSASSSFQSWS